MKTSKRTKHRLIVVIIVVTVGLTLMAAAYVGRDLYRERAAAAGYEAALVALGEARFDEALPRLSEYVSRHPNDVAALVTFADCRWRVPTPDQSHLRFAQHLYRRALELDPDNEDALDGLLSLFKQSGRRIELENIAERIIARSPKHIAALEALVMTRLAVGDAHTAGLHAETLCTVDPARLEFRELLLAVRARDGAAREELLAYCDELVATNLVGDGRWRLLRGMTRLRYREPGGREDLLAAAERGVEQELFEDLLWALEAFGERDAATTLLESARNEYPAEAWPHVFAIRLEWINGRFHDARRIVDEALELVGRDERIPLLHWRALTAAVNGDVTLTRRTLRELSEFSDAASSADRHLIRARIEIAEGLLDSAEFRWLDAVGHYRMAISRLASVEAERGAIRLDRAIAHYLQGQALIELGEVRDAVRHFDAAFIDSHRRWVLAGVAKADAQRMAGALRDSFETIAGVVIGTSPTITHPWLVLGQSWLAVEAAGQFRPAAAIVLPWNDALAYLEHVYESTDANQEFLPLLVEANRLHGDETRARRVLEDASHLGELGTDVAVRLARLALASQQPALAGQLITKCDPRTARQRLDQMSVQANIIAQERSAEEGLAHLRLRITEFVPDDRELVDVAAVRFCVLHDLAAADEFVARLLDRDALRLSTAIDLIQIEQTWKSRDRAEKTINHLKRALQQTEGAGGDSKPVMADPTPLLLAQSELVRRFDRENEQRIAELILELSNIHEQGRSTLPVFVTLANLSLTGSKPSERNATQWLRLAIDTYPQSSVLYPTLIALLQKQGDFSTARRYLEQFGERRQLDDSQTRISSMLLARQGDFESAAQRLANVLDDRASETDQLAAASLLLRAGRYREVEDAIHRLLAQDQCAPMTVLFAAQFYDSMGNAERAESVIRTTALVDEDVRPLLLGSYYFRRGEHQKAEAALQQALAKDAEQVEAMLWLGRLNMERGQFADAIAMAQRGLAINPDQRELRLLLATCVLAGTEADRSAALQTIREIGGDNRDLIDSIEFFVKISRNDGTLDANTGNLKEARQLVQTHPTFMPLLRLAIAMHAQADEIGQAAEMALTAANRMPDLAEPARLLTELQIQRGRFDEARDSAIMWRQRSMDDPLPASRALAAIALDQRRLREALDTLVPLASRIEQIGPDDPALMELWTVTLLMNGQVERAFQFQRPFIAADDDFFGSWLKITRILPAPTATNAIESVDAHATSTHRRLDLAMAWADLGSRLDRDRDPAAHSCFAKAEDIVAAEPVNADDEIRILLSRAIVAAAGKDYQRARGLYEDVLESAPANIIALNNLAMLLSLRLDLLDEAHVMSTRLMAAIAPLPAADVAPFLDTHAQILLQLGRLVEAEKVIARATSAAPDRPSLMITEARIHIARSRSASARDLLNRAEAVLRQSLIRSPETEESLHDARAEVEATR